MSPAKRKPAKRSRPRAKKCEASVLGWRSEDHGGFGFGPASGDAREPVSYEGAGHRMTFGVTGSGKGVSSAIPELLTVGENMIVLDPKAELYHVTSRWRRESLGHQTILVDPFAVAGCPADSLNPLDLAPLLGVSAYEAATTIATLFVGGEQRSAHTRNTTNDEFWQDQATNLLVGLLGAAMEGRLGEEKTLGAVRGLLKSDDAIYNMAVLLDTNAPSRPFREEIASFLGTVEVTRSGIQSTLMSHFRGFGGEGVEKALGSTSFDLQAFVHGDLAATLYIVVPPEQLAAQAKLLRILFGTLMSALYTRRYIPKLKTRILIDEAASLGAFEPIRTGVTLLRGSGVILSLLFQDIDQVLRNYHDARTLINNTSVIRLLGASNYWQAAVFADLFGLPPTQLMNLKPDEQLLLIDGQPTRCRRVNYLIDRCFRGRFDPNPRHAEDQAPQARRKTGASAKSR